MSVEEKPLLSMASAPIRVEPVQARSAARVNALLDAACETMHDLGYEQLTTAMVAERAGASIGTVYRYFPDRIAVLQSVASRNLDRALEVLSIELGAGGSATLESSMDVAVEALAGLFRSEKGFRSLRVGDVLDIRPAVGARAGNAEIARVIREDLEKRTGIRLDSGARLSVETAVDVADALLGRAFLHSNRGEASLISEAKRVAVLAVKDVTH
jgi:AcrR family transcriptional regulator